MTTLIRRAQFRGAAFVVFLCGFIAAQQPANSSPKNLDELAHKYSIKIELEDKSSPVAMTTGKITFQPAPKQQLPAYLKLVVAEFNRYPVKFVKKTKLERIVFCTDLAFNGQRRGALPDFEHNTLYLDVVSGNYNEAYQRKVIHHEYFHIVDYVDDGQLYRDDAWAKLNPPDFKYGSGGKNMQSDGTVNNVTDSVPGFLNKYSTSGVEEDKAELFGLLMTDRAAVVARAKRDRVVAAKVERLKKLLTDFCADSDEMISETARTKSNAGASNKQ